MRPALRFALLSLSAVLLTACGKPREPEAGAPANATSPTPAQSGLPSIPPPEPEPTPAVAPTPAQKTLYVVTEFRAVSQLGTHEFPPGTEVQLLEEDGEEVVVQAGQVAVKIHRSYFSETAPVASAAETPPASAAPTPDEIAIDRPLEEPPATDSTAMFEPAPTPTPVAELSPEERRVAEITDSIRAIDDKLREARAGGAPEATTQKLKRERDQLSEELTSYGKP